MAHRLNARAILRKYGLKPKVGWSQNFLVDVRVMEAIVRAARLEESQAVIELGAGIGALSARLSRVACRVVAVERDRDLAALLRQEFAGDPLVEVCEANAATLDFRELSARLGGRPVVVGNLPYHMATPILFHLLSSGQVLSHWVLMFQKELADRLLSDPGNRDYGVLSVLVQQKAEIEPLLDVEPQAFYPAPKVRSRLLRFWPLSAPRVKVQDQQMFDRVVRAAFAQRRKKVRNSLMATIGSGMSPQQVDRALESSGVDGSMRAEQLSLLMFARLADAFLEEEKGPSG